MHPFPPRWPTHATELAPARATGDARVTPDATCHAPRDVWPGDPGRVDAPGREDPPQLDDATGTLPDWPLSCLALTCLQDEQLAIYATATIALGHIIYKVDQIQGIVRSLVGERRFDVLDELARERAEGDVEWLGRV